MVADCPKCGNYGWDKEVSGTTVRCPKCGNEWTFRKLPLFVLSGCSGVGKTTTAQALIQRRPDFVVLDADDFYSIMNPQTPEEHQQWVERMMKLSTDIVQSGRPVLWAMAGCLDLFPKAYHRRFFGELHCLALTCGEQELRRRMTEGRGIADEGWIQSSVDYNRYFQTHSQVGEMRFETLDIMDKPPEARAACIEQWIRARWTEE